MDRTSQLRAGDGDRERVAADMREHFAAGRLLGPPPADPTVLRRRGPHRL